MVNLGMYGVKSAAPIVTSPQAAVLALGAIEERVLPASDPEKVYRLAQVLTGEKFKPHWPFESITGPF